MVPSSGKIRCVVVLGDVECNCRDFLDCLEYYSDGSEWRQVETFDASWTPPSAPAPPTSPVSAAGTQQKLWETRFVANHSFSFLSLLRSHPALHIFYSRISVSKMSAATESATAAATSGGESPSASVDASAGARKQGERLQPAR